MDLTDLNPEQRAAVRHFQGPMLVVAGPGTGKTAVITRRIAYLIQKHHVKPDQILALTFTEKAAGEMLDRLDALIGWQAYQVNVMTFHAFGANLLSRYGHHLGLVNRSEIISDTSKLLLLKKHLGEVKLSYYGQLADILDFLQGQLNFILALQNADITPESYEQYVSSLKKTAQHPMDVAEAQDRLQLYRLYESIKLRYGLIDYHDQIKLPWRLLAERPNLAARVAELHPFVLVDEYQDTNGIQDALLRQFIPPDGNIFAVGDDDQAIYGFRGASIGNILAFTEHFKVKKPIVLRRNYRSSKQIAESAYRLIQHNNPERLESKLGLSKKPLTNSEGDSPELILSATPREEYALVVAAIKSRLKKGVPGQIAVLATSHRVLRELARQMTRANVPFYLTSTINIFEQTEVRQLWHLLRWIGWQAEDEAIIQVLMGPFVVWLPNQVRKVTDKARREGITLEGALEDLRDPASKQLVAKLAKWRQLARELPVSQLIYNLTFESGLAKQWAKQAEVTPRMVRVFEDLQIWLGQAQEFEYASSDATLIGYLATYPRPPEIEAEEVTGDTAGVALLTVHAAKGLEFETVYIIRNSLEAWSESSPYRNADLPMELLAKADQLPAEHERRRLMYVAMTRAKANLILSAPSLHAGGRAQKPSPFLAEIFEPADFLGSKIIDSTDTKEQLMQKLQRYANLPSKNAIERLPFESSDGWLQLSATDLEKYDDCPYEFYLEKVLRLHTPVGPPVKFGKLMHDLFHDYYELSRGGEPNVLKYLEEKLETSWSSQGYRSTSEAEVAFKLAQKTLQTFFRREEKAQRLLRSSEEAFILKFPEAKLKIVGRIDASFHLAEGIEVRDFKTGRLRDAEKLSLKAKNSLQLRTYALALEQMSGQPPAAVVLDYVVTGVEGRAELSPRILENHRDKLVTMAEQIRERHFAPKRSPYHNCMAHRYWGEAEDEDA